MTNETNELKLDVLDFFNKEEREPEKKETNTEKANEHKMFLRTLAILAVIFLTFIGTLSCFDKGPTSAEINQNRIWLEQHQIIRPTQYK